jgi:hypothetical protein
MKKICIAVFFLSFVYVSISEAGPTVTCSVKEVSRHELLVTYSWEVSIVSDKKWDACDLHIAFLDGHGREIFAVSERLEMKIGKNLFSGSDICEKKLWQRAKKYSATLDCIF